MSSPVAYTEIAAVPLKWVGPLPVWLSEGLETLWVPLATYESPLWPSTRRGALVAGHSGGVRCTVLDDRMTRSILLEAAGAAAAQEVVRFAKEEMETLQTWTAATSRFARLIDVHAEIVGPLLFLRLAFQTGDASGHNMSTKAAERILRGLVDKFPGVTEVSVSGNLCCDKKVSAVNGLLGRGKSVVAEALIPDADTEVLAVWETRAWQGKAAITRRAVGRGQVIHVGTWLTAELTRRLADLLDRGGRMPPAYALPEGLEAVERLQPDGTRLRFVINHTDTAVNLPLSGPCTDVLSGETLADGSPLPPNGVRVLRLPDGV